MVRSSTFRVGNVSDTDLRLLRVFRTVVERGGFAQAEAELNVTRAAISQSIADLEQRLGLRLCQRGRAGFALTEEGGRVLAALERLLTSVEDFRSEVHAIHDRLQGELCIGITDNLVTMPRMRVTRALKALKEQGPDVSIRIQMMPPSEVEQGVLDGRLHVGVIPELRRMQGLSYIDLYDETSSLYCAHNHPLFLENKREIDLARLRECDVVMPAYGRPSDMETLFRQLSSTATATDREGVAFLILTGLYLGFLPVHYAQQWVRDGKMRAIRGDLTGYTTRFAAVTRTGHRPNLVLETFIAQF